jgi:hypothetical protein
MGFRTFSLNNVVSQQEQQDMDNLYQLIKDAPQFTEFADWCKRGSQRTVANDSKPKPARLTPKQLARELAAENFAHLRESKRQEFKQGFDQACARDEELEEWKEQAECDALATRMYATAKVVRNKR